LRAPLGAGQSAARGKPRERGKQRGGGGGGGGETGKWPGPAQGQHPPLGAHDSGRRRGLYAIPKPGGALLKDRITHEGSGRGPNARSLAIVPTKFLSPANHMLAKGDCLMPPRTWAETLLDQLARTRPVAKTQAPHRTRPRYQVTSTPQKAGRMIVKGPPPQVPSGISWPSDFAVFVFTRMVDPRSWFRVVDRLVG